MNELFIFNFLFTVYYEKSNNYSYFGLVKKKKKKKEKTRSSRSQVLYQTGVIKNFAKFTGKHLCWSLLFNKRFLENTSGASEDRKSSSRFVV